MNWGFIKVAVAIPNVRVGDVSYNLSRTQLLLKRADKQGAEVVVFPELGLTGYTCGDLFRQTILLKSAQDALKDLVSASSRLSILGAVGMPIRVGNTLYNCAVIFQKGKILGVVPKTFLPNTAEFQEKRWFVSAEQCDVKEISLAGQTVAFGTDLLFTCGSVHIGVEICEDLWASVPPSSLAALAGANVILNLSASNEIVGKNDYLKQLILQQSARCCCGYVYASAGWGESSTDLVFAGNGLIAESGSWVAKSKRFETDEQLIIADIDAEKLQAERASNVSFTENEMASAYRCIAFSRVPSKKFILTKKVNPFPFLPPEDKYAQQCEEILSIQAHGLAKRLAHTGCKGAVIGVSGGLDSTLALLVTARAFDLLHLPHSEIVGITMPCFGTSDRTYKNAQLLMKALHITTKEINIKAALTQHLKDLKHPLTDKNVTYENAQARERTQVLMDMANDLNAMVIGTGDLSELALGWATYNGDHMSMYGVNASIPKTLVRALVKYEAEKTTDKKLRATLLDILNTPISPELLPAKNKQIVQKTEDLVGPYELHDFFLYYFIHFGFSPRKIEFLAQHAFAKRYTNAEIKKWLQVFLRRFFAQQFKRSCLPDGPKATTVSLSPRGDWRMPSDACITLWQEDVK